MMDVIHSLGISGIFSEFIFGVPPVHIIVSLLCGLFEVHFKWLPNHFSNSFFVFLSFSKSSCILCFWIAIYIWYQIFATLLPAIFFSFLPSLKPGIYYNRNIITPCDNFACWIYFSSICILCTFKRAADINDSVSWTKPSGEIWSYALGEIQQDKGSEQLLLVVWRNWRMLECLSVRNDLSIVNGYKVN